MKCVCAVLVAVALPSFGVGLGEGGEGLFPYRLPSRAATRLVVLYHPDLSSCQPQEMRALRVLNKIESEYSEVEVVTILPDVTSLPTDRYGERFPGRRFQISDRSFFEEGEWAPRPRIEAWSRDGRLLLLMGLHPAIREDRLLDGVLWARTFTKPPPHEVQ